MRISKFVTICLVLFFVFGQVTYAQKGGDKAADNFKENRIQPRRDFSQMLEKVKREKGSDWEKDALEEIKTEHPDEIDQLLKKKRKNPKQYEEQLIRLWDKTRRMKDVKRKDPERYAKMKRQNDLDKECKKLARDYGTTNDKNKQKEIRALLNSNLSELFDLREKDREEKITRLEEELEQLKDMVEFRKKNKEKIIENYLEELLGNDKKLKW